MNFKNAIFLFAFLSGLFLSSFCQNEVIINTSQGTFKLPPPEDCVSDECIKGIPVVAALAGNALAADINKATAESDKAVNVIASLEQEYSAANNNYKTALAPYNAKLDKYKTDVDKYTGELTVHNNRVIANNSLPPERRSETEVSYLNQNKIRLDQWKGGLDQWKKNLDADREPLSRQWQELQSKKNNLQSKSAELAQLQLKVNEALEQLKKCDHYGQRALKAAKEKNIGTYKTANDFFGSLKIIPSIDLLNENLEKMKAWSGKVWD